ncbi:MAG TPA: hypothetical protein VLN49_05945 [Gemmatimonadaceae bacterium]|nr:hypothetical protein [Gemmatimonadaceae bacterium]
MLLITHQRTRRLAWRALVVAFCAASPTAAQHPARQPADTSHTVAPPTPDSLAAVTDRGRRLARSDFAAWHATDAVLALNPSPRDVRGYVALKDGATWLVEFGRMSEDSGAFLVAYEAREADNRPDSFLVTRREPARRDTSRFLRAARAVDVARAAFTPEHRPYNTMVLPLDDGTWFVYIVPAQVQSTVYPLGGDVRYHVAADGRRILETRRLHNAIIEFTGAAPKPGSTLQAGTHAAVRDDIPEDSDVFHVLVRQPAVPEYIVTNAFVYRVDVDGSIHLLGRRTELLRRHE